MGVGGSQNRSVGGGRLSGEDTDGVATSGAIQYGVPTKLLAGLAMAADPKSASLMSPTSVSRMFPAWGGGDLG